MTLEKEKKKKIKLQIKSHKVQGGRKDVNAYSFKGYPPEGQKRPKRQAFQLRLSTCSSAPPKKKRKDQKKKMKKKDLSSFERGWLTGGKQQSEHKQRKRTTRGVTTWEEKNEGPITLDDSSWH